MYVPEFQSERKPVTSSDVPRVLYQCADCELLFDALLLWQQHRKVGCNVETGPGPGNAAAASESQQVSQAVADESEVDYHNQPIKLEEGSRHEVSVETQPSLPSSSDPPEPCEEPAPQLPESTEPVQEPSPQVRRRGQKKAKPPSSLLCVECGRCFSLASELVTHRKTVHNLKETIHRCSVCGEGFLNTTLFLYHRKQHRSQTQEEEQKEVEVPQISTALLEAPGEGLLLLATAGEGQSLMEITTLEQTVSEAVSIAQVEVELDHEIRGKVIQTSGDEPVPQAVEGEQVEEMEVEGIVNMEGEEVEGQAVPTNEEVVEEKQVETELSNVELARMDGEAPSMPSARQNFLCSQCGCSFNAEHVLAKHRSSEHGLAEALHSCTECGQEFMNTTQFLYHRREHRKNVPPPSSARLNATLTSLAKHPPASPALLLRRPGQ